MSMQTRDRRATLDDDEVIVTLFQSTRSGGSGGEPLRAVRLKIDPGSAENVEYWIAQGQVAAPDAEDENEAGMTLRPGDAPVEFMGVVGGSGTIDGIYVRSAGAAVEWEPIWA